MLRVLSHYLPIRKALLVSSETLILWGVVALAGTAHLWEPTRVELVSIALENMSEQTARLHCVVSAFFVAVLAQLAIVFNELYDFRVSSSRYDRAGRFVGSMGSAIGLVLGAVLLSRVWGLGRALDFPGLSFIQTVQVLVYALLIGFALLFGWRGLFHDLLRRSGFDERVLIVGSGKAAHVLAKEMREHSASGFQVVGILPVGAERAEAPAFDPSESGTADMVLQERLRSGDAPDAPSLEELAQRLRIDVLVVAMDDRRGRLPTEQLLGCRLAGISVRDYEGVFERVTGKIAVEALRPSYLIFNEGFARHAWGDLLKRAVDFVLALVGLLVAWPVMALTAVAVRMDSPGPVFFTQERLGRDGRKFTLVKFRSMFADAEKRTGPVWATEDDPRITKVGRFLRKSRLDELPQLLNVLLGSMSFVGPRPEREHFVDDLATQIPYFRQRLIVKPGLTGWAQINYPYGNTVEDALQKLQYDLFYIKYQSFLFDLSILFNTIKTIVLRKGT